MIPPKYDACIYGADSELHVMTIILLVNFEEKSRLEKFFRVPVSPFLNYQHMFGCLVYAIHFSLAAGQSIPKWDSCERLGIHLGPSPKHAHSVTLALNPTTGLVSLEYYVTFHDFFKTICFNHVETALPYARQKLTGFVNEEKNWGKS